MNSKCSRHVHTSSYHTNWACKSQQNLTAKPEKRAVPRESTSKQRWNDKCQIQETTSSTGLCLSRRKQAGKQMKRKKTQLVINLNPSMRDWKWQLTFFMIAYIKNLTLNKLFMALRASYSDGLKNLIFVCSVSQFTDLKIFHLLTRTYCLKAECLPQCTITVCENLHQETTDSCLTSITVEHQGNTYSLL